jgi:probable HAF family extracellular repeat protein
MNTKTKLIVLAFILAVTAPAHQATAYYKLIDLGTLGGNDSCAYSINNIGQIVGWALDSSARQRATLFDPTGGENNINLGIPLGGTSSVAYSINDNGQIVGGAQDWSGNGRAILFDPTGSGNNIDLNTLIDSSLGWRLGSAYSINDNGWIVGSGINPDGYTRAYLLIPEPTTLSLFALAGVVLLRKCRTKNFWVFRQNLVG